MKATLFEIKGNELTVAMPAQDTRTGQVKLGAVNGRHIQLDVTRPSGEHDSMSLTMENDHAVAWDIGDDRTITLERVVASN